MEPPEYKSTLPLEILAASLATRLTIDELEWLSRDLAQRTEAHGREEVHTEQGAPLAPATLRYAWEQLRGATS